MNKLIFVFSLFLVFACTETKEVIQDKPVVIVANPPEPTPVVYTAAQLADGKAIYEKNCAMCHELFVPSQFGEAKWRHEVEDMVPMANSEKNAGISKDQEALILAYLLANCKK